MGTSAFLDGDDFGNGRAERSKLRWTRVIPVDESTQIMGLLEYNTRTSAPLSGGNDIYYTVEYVRYLGEQTLEIRFSQSYKASPAGTTVILRHQIYSYDALTGGKTL